MRRTTKTGNRNRKLIRRTSLAGRCHFFLSMNITRLRLIITLIHNTISALLNDSDNIIHTYILDFTKAFHTINHKLLVAKCK